MCHKILRSGINTTVWLSLGINMDLRRSRWYGATMCFELHVKSFSGYNNAVMSTKGTGMVVAQLHNHHLFTLSIFFNRYKMCWFSVFMWRNHIPKLKYYLSFWGPYRNLTFHNVLARQGSSYCYRARLNSQAFALRDMKIATREGCRVGQKMSYHFSFANWAVLALEETFISVCRSSIAIILRFTSKTQWQMFLLLYGGHVCVPHDQEDTNMASPYKAL